MNYPMSMLSNFFDVEPITERLSDFDAWEDDDKLVLKFPMAGYGKGNISVVIKEGILSVEASKQKEEGNKKYLVRARPLQVSRSIALPSGLSEDHAKSTYENGVLTVEIPYSVSKKPKRIEIDYKE